MSKPRVIAFYLPQYYPTPENDEWWGKGFTEWTNVGKAKPLFKGHNQPRVPADLGYYDLRLPDVREQQVELAKEAGVTAFCYWHYWFGNGRRLLSKVFDEVLETGRPDFPFCLGWANHNWYAKEWNSDGTTTNKLLIEQTYPGIEDAKLHFQFLLKAFNDARYVKIEGKPLFYIYRPNELPEDYIVWFKKWTIEAGFPGLLVIAQLSPSDSKKNYVNKGYDLFLYQRLAGNMRRDSFRGQGFINWLARLIWGLLRHRPPFIFNYKNAIPFLITKEEEEEDVVPCVVPQWDHTPRSGWNGSLFVNSTPDLFYKHVLQALEVLKKKSPEKRILFVKSWNEWGEGNYMEPDLTNGKGFIEAMRRALSYI